MSVIEVLADHFIDILSYFFKLLVCHLLGTKPKSTIPNCGMYETAIFKCPSVLSSPKYRVFNLKNTEMLFCLDIFPSDKPECSDYFSFCLSPIYLNGELVVRLKYKLWIANHRGDKIGANYPGLFFIEFCRSYNVRSLETGRVFEEGIGYGNAKFASHDQLRSIGVIDDKRIVSLCCKITRLPLNEDEETCAVRNLTLRTSLYPL